MFYFQSKEKTSKNIHDNYTILCIEKHVNNIIRHYLDRQINIERNDMSNSISQEWSHTLKTDLDINGILIKMLCKSDYTKTYFDSIFDMFIRYIKTEQKIVGMANVFKNYLIDIYNKSYESDNDDSTDGSDDSSNDSSSSNESLEDLITRLNEDRH